MPACLVIMAFRDELNSHLELIKRCGERLGLEIRRVDTYAYSGNILQAISKALAQADLIVADLSTANPNVMYELAIAQCLGKKIVLLTNDRNTIPFDLLTYRVEMVDLASKDQVERLCQAIQLTLDATYISGPLGGTVVFGQRLFFRRFAAFLIDAVPFVAAPLLFGYLSGPGGSGLTGDLSPIVVVAELSGFAFLLYAAASTAMLGATIGQRMLDLRVVTMDGDRPTFLRALGRVTSAIPLVIMTYGIGFLWCLRGPSFRTFPDIATQTMLVRRSGMRHGGGPSIKERG